MPLSAEHQRARRHKMTTKEFNPEPTYVIEAGDDTRTRYRRIVQYGYDWQFECNENHVKRELAFVQEGGELPSYKQKEGSPFNGRFNPTTMFRPTWFKATYAGPLGTFTLVQWP